jgi:hypothetical protein
MGYRDSVSVWRKPLTISLAGPLAIRAAVRAARSSLSLERSSVKAKPVRYPDPAAYADSLAGGLDQTLDYSEGGAGDGFEVKIRIIAAGGERFAQTSLHQSLGQA